MSLYKPKVISDHVEFRRIICDYLDNRCAYCRHNNSYSKVKVTWSVCSVCNILNYRCKLYGNHSKIRYVI